MEIIKIEARLIHAGYGYEVTKDNKILMGVPANKVKPGDKVVSVVCEFGVIKSMVVIRDIDQCDFEAVRIIP